MTNSVVSPIKLMQMIILWHFGAVDSLTLFQFCLNCGAQYGGLVVAEAAGSMNDIGPSAFLAPLVGLGTSYKYVRAAQGMERRARIANVAAFMAMSGRATLTDPATNGAVGGALATFIGHMKSIIEKSNNDTGGVVFLNPGTFSKLTNGEFIVLNVVIIVGGVILIILSSHILPRIGKAYLNSSKRLTNYTLTYLEKRIENLGQIKKSKRIRKFRYSISKLSSRMCVPLKSVGFVERRTIKVGRLLARKLYT